MFDFLALVRRIEGFFRSPSSNQLYPFEQQFCMEAIGRLRPHSRKILHRQLCATNKIQRILDGTSVNIYILKNGIPIVNGGITLQRIPQDTRFFTANLKRSISSNEILSVLVYLVRGRIFEFEYSESPSAFFFNNPCTNIFHVEEIEFHIDLDALEEEAVRNNNNIDSVLDERNLSS